MPSSAYDSSKKPQEKRVFLAALAALATANSQFTSKISAQLATRRSRRLSGEIEFQD
jgi:hypothetical protein